MTLRVWWTLVCSCAMTNMGFLGVCEKRGKETAGPSTTLRSGRDDNFAGPQELQRERHDPRDKIVIPTGAKRRDLRFGSSFLESVFGPSEERLRS
jgi:hypothetical protein